MAERERSLEEPLPRPERRPGFDEAGDATRRTALASERTLLAWVRTGLTLTAVAIAVGHVVPELSDDTRTWPYVLVGAGYAVVGVAVVLYGLFRGREVDRALRDGRWVPLDDRAMWAIGGATIVLGLAAVGLIVAGS